jgi:hypothetical protein
MKIALHPARRNPQQLLGVLLLVAIAAALLATLVPPLTAIALTGVLLANLGDFFLPTSYDFTEVGLQVRRGPWDHSYPWSRFSSFVVDRNGILLSTFRERHPLESFRGQFLALNPDDRAVVVRWLSEKLVRRG